MQRDLQSVGCLMQTPDIRSTRPWWAAPVLRWSLGILLAAGLGIVAFEAFDISIFRRIGLAHEYCYQREPRLIWLHVTSDALIGVAYVTIAATLGYLVYKASKGIPFHWAFLAFGLFIFSCGFTHFMEVWVIWEPVYWLSGYVKVITAAASVATAVALFPLVPRVLRLVDAARRSEERRIEIEQLNAELERYNYSVAHDLRGPLRGIAGFSQALREDCPGELSENARQYLDAIAASVERMNGLITDLLRNASVSRQNLSFDRVELAEAVANTLSLLGPEIRRRNATLAAAPGLPAVRGDATLLQVVLQNLVNNAMKFTAPDVAPKVEINATVEGGFVILTITDNGIGIPPDRRDRAFRMFERFDRQQEGTGVGLTIVQRAVERLNGAIGIRDAPGGQGTTFWVKLPRAQDGSSSRSP